jgi:PAS domain S-box-containing protein
VAAVDKTGDNSKENGKLLSLEREAGLQILAVDDEPEFLSLIELILRSNFRADVLTATDCASARDALTSQQFDLITIDFQLPDGSGLELLREIAVMENHPPAILVTGYGDESTAVQCFDLGASGYVVKDIRMSTMLTETIRRVLGLKRMEEALRDSEVRYRRLFEAAKDGILILDAETSRITDANPFLLNLLGFARDDLVGKELWELSPFKGIEETKDAVLELKEKGYVRYEHLPLETKSGGRADVEFVSNMYIEGDRKVIQCNIRDITARKQREAHQDAVIRELESYARSVSHDLGAPLSSIELAAQLLGKVLEDPEVEKLGMTKEDLLEMITNAADKAGKLISDLLVLAQDGQSPTETEMVDVKSIVEEVLEEWAVTISDRCVTIRVSPDLGRIFANRSQMHQVFGNLIGNALKHASADELEIKIQYLGEDETGAHTYQVRDNGQGVAEEVIDQLFKPFFRCDEGGTGIGLSIVESVVRTYGGKIQVYNDNGACFDFTMYDAVPSKP